MSIRKSYVLSLVILVFLSSVSFGQGFLRPERGNAQSRPNASGLQRYTVHTYSDQFSDGWAFRLLIPEGWQFQGGISWLSKPGKLAEVHFAVSEPMGNAALEIMPDYYFWWSQNQYVAQQFQAAGLPVAQPMNAAQLLEQYIVPNMRGNVQNLRVVDRVNLSTAARDLTAAVQRQQQVDQCFAAISYGTQSNYDVAHVDITYSNGGVQVFERIIARVLYVNNQMQGSIMWGPERTVSMRTVLGQKDAMMEKFLVMYSSLTENPVFLSKICQVNQMLVQTQRQISQNAGELSDYLSRTNDEISDIIRGVYENKNAADDRIFDNWGDYMRGVRTYTDGEIQLKIPQMAESVWRNGNTVVYSNQPGFNPHQVLQGSWTQMNQRR